MFNKGDKVHVVRGDGFTHSGVHTVTKVGVQYVEIEDGRQFIRTTGEWISEFAGSQPIKWSFPTIVHAPRPSEMDAFEANERSLGRAIDWKDSYFMARWMGWVDRAVLEDARNSLAAAESRRRPASGEEMKAAEEAASIRCGELLSDLAALRKALVLAEDVLATNFGHVAPWCLSNGGKVAPQSAIQKIRDALNAHRSLPGDAVDAAAIARAIFKCGDEPRSKTWRIQFMGGNIDDERGMGGLNETALTRVIDEAMRGGGK